MTITATTAPVPPRVLANSDPALRRAWHPVARSSEVGPEPGTVRLLGDDWALVRGPDGLVASAGRCPPQPSDPPPAGLTERHGVVWLAPGEPVTALIEVPELVDPTFLVGDLPMIEAAVGAGLMVDNFLDVAHFPFVHAATIGTEDAEEVGALSVTREGLGMTVVSEQLFPNHEDPAVATGARPLLQHRRATYTYRAPFSLRLRLDYIEAGGANVITFFVQPVDEGNCRLYTSVARNDLDGDEARLGDALAFEATVLAEDLALQERYVDKVLPLDLTAEVHIKADRMTIELRRILTDLVTAAAA